jgi:hypothetical protein
MRLEPPDRPIGISSTMEGKRCVSASGADRVSSVPPMGTGFRAPGGSDAGAIESAHCRR